MLNVKSFKQMQVAVLCGGWSSERDISLASGNAVVEGLKKSGVAAFKIDLPDPRQAIEILRETDVDYAFITLHGTGGEDGMIQSILESLKIPYTGSGILASAVAMNKLISKRVWISEGLPTPSFVELYEGFDSQYVVEHLGLPLAVKPVSEGSSLGITCVKNCDQLTAAWEKAAQYGSSVFAENWIDGEEYSVAFVGKNIFPPVHLKTNRDFYDYQAKYQASDTQYICPADLDLSVLTEMQTLAWSAAEVLKIRGWGRIDLRREENGKCWLLEANTVPGMTTHSLVPISAKAEQINFDQLTLKILTANEEDHVTDV